MSNVATEKPLRESAGAEKRAAAFLSVSAAAVITSLKLVVGFMTHSLGMLSDAAHSGIDLFGACLTLLSVRVADKPADDDHPYGHAKVENLSAFFETFLMLASSIWITVEAILRIFVNSIAVRHSIWPFLVLLLSIVVDLTRSRRLKKVAEEHHSDALAANALHFASDIWSSIAVLVGLAASWIGASTFGAAHGLQWLRLADPAAAIVVSALILYFGTHLAWRTIGALTDSVPRETRSRVLAELERTDGVLSVDQARMRRAGGSYFADFTLSLSRQLTFPRTEELVRDATSAVHRVLPGADVVIHTVPRSTVAESIFDKVRAVASRNNVVLHDVSVQSFKGGLHVEQHIEVNEDMSLMDAHSFVRKIEDEIRRDLPQVSEVLTHIESEPATIEVPKGMARDQNIEKHLRHAAAALPDILDIHHVVVGRVGDKLQLSCHCTLPDELPMHRVHEVITDLEDRFKLECPKVYRVLIHPEPATDNHHH
jgi:cation diffusion facilitator family transporter